MIKMLQRSELRLHLDMYVSLPHAQYRTPIISGTGKATNSNLADTLTGSV